MNSKALVLTEPTHRNIEHKGDIIISDEYVGLMHCEGHLTIKKTAVVSGEIHTQSAHISGVFKGFLEVEKHVIFTDGSLFQGTLDAGSMVCSLRTTLIGDIRVKPRKK